MFEWWFFFDAYAHRVFDTGGAIAGSSGLVAVLVAIAMSVWRSRQSKLVTTYGSARWADASDIRKAGLTQPAGVFLGRHSDQYLRHEGPEHVLTFAPTRSGKGVGLVIPTLLSWPASTVIHDIKGENWQITAGWRSRFSHCLLFNPTDPKSAAYNPLLEVRRGAHEVRDIQNIADILVDPEGALERRNHWEKTSHALLVGAIQTLEVSYARDSATLLASLQAICDAPSKFMDMDAFASEKSVIESKIASNALLLATKKKEPSLTVKLEPLSDALASAVKLISVANAAVTKHNDIARNIAKERRDLTAQVWKYVLDTELKADLASYSTKKTGTNAAIAKLTGQIQEAAEAKAKLNTEIKALEKSATSVQPTIDGINSLLNSFGFRSFLLAMADDGGAFYKLVRHNGNDAKETLSEGEKSFVTFLYFYHLLKGSESESGMTANRVVVFDDPVSSLDSDILFIVSSLIKALFDEIRADKGHIKQIFILTHNVYFHKEVTYTTGRGDDKKKDERSYWVVRKTDGGAMVERHPTNPIKTSYDLLWGELRRKDRSKLTIQNTLRRILENYFKILGDIDFDAICEEFDGKDKVMCRSLFAWVNDGSHFAHDDAFFTFDDAAIEVYLDIFKQVFIKTNQLPHYEMMMGIDD